MLLRDCLLITHFIGLALLLGTGFGHLTLGIATRAMDAGARTQFVLRTFALSKNGSVGLLLLLLSGVGLMMVRGVSETFDIGGPALHAKLTLVAVLIGLLAYMQVLTKRAKAAQGGPALLRIPPVGVAMLLTGLGIVVSAVLAFH